MNWIKKNIKFFFDLFAYNVLPSRARKQNYNLYKSIFLNGKVDQEFEVLPYIINSESMVIDIGANNGEYCYFFQKIIQTKSIIAFEPIPSLFRRLKILYPKIQVYPYAVSDQTRKSQLYIPYINSEKYETRAKLDLLPEKGQTKLITVNVDTISLDELLGDEISKINFIKIDIEGHELQAIRGAKKIISRFNPILMIEIEYRHHQNDFYAVIDEICLMGYTCNYYDRVTKLILDISHFSISLHQNLNNKENYYIHNLFFFPLNYSIETLNSILKKT